MAIYLPRSSPEEIEIVRASVPTLFTAAPAGSRMRAMAELTRQVSVSGPHRVFVATLQDVMAGQVLANAREAAKRYFLVHTDDEPFAAAEVAGNQFAHVNEGPFVQSTARSMIVAEQLDAVQERDYELRLLRIPALYTVAVWLSSTSDDILIPSDPVPAPLRPDTPYTEEDFTEALKPLAEVRSQAQDSMA